MNLDQCKNLLQQELQANQYEVDDVESMTIDAWGDRQDRMECYREFWWSWQINDFVQEKKQNYQDDWTQDRVHWAAEEEDDEMNQEELHAQEESSQEDEGVFWPIIEEWIHYARIGLLIAWALILWYFAWRLFKFLFEFLYDVFSVRRLVYLRVMLPRWDSREEREMQKEIAKDMHEKIARMSQVYRNVHKLWELSVWDVIMSFIFCKPKLSLGMHYENWMIQYIFAIYPEYKNILEWAITAQYSDASVETIGVPRFFKKKYNDLIPMHPEKDPVYPVRVFKQLEDDPMNNLLDAIWKIPNDDTFTIFMTIKPEWSWFNNKAQEFSTALYKKDESVTINEPLWKKIIFPWKLIDFLIYWPSNALVKKYSDPHNPYGSNTQWDPLIRMIKAEEDALNTMWDEAGKPAFTTWLMLITSSNYKDRLNANLQSLVSALTIYKDEYNNWLDQPEILHDIFGFIFKPLWRFAVFFHLPNFFYRRNILTVNELAWLLHLPDWLFNRSPIIKWMDYKALPAPDNLPELKEPNEFFITWKIAEEYKDWDLSKIFSDSRHWWVWKKVETKEELIPIEKFSEKELLDKEIVEDNWKKYVKKKKRIKKTWLRVFKDGTLLWINVHRNRFTPVYMKRKDRSRHHYIIWKSGWGKSVYIASLARQDVWNWDWLCVIDPHWDLVEDILEYIPKERAKDVIYFDAWDEDRPMWLNLYEIDNPDQADRVVNDATEIFMKMFWPEIFGPRIQEYFKYASLTLLEDMEDWATLIDVPRLFTDQAFREYKIKKVKNPVVRNFWEKTYNAMGDREKQEIIPYFSSKFVNFITNRLIRNIIWQTKSAVKFREAMDEWKILLVNLSKWKIWEMNAQLLGMILVSQINTAAMSRADIPEDQRRDFFLYVDEFQNFVTDTFADILSEARKYHLSLIMAHQYIWQLESNAWNNLWESWWWVKDAVFGNVWTMQSFKVWAPDAEVLEKEYAPVLSPQDIVWISNFKTYMKLNINNASSRVFSMNTIWTEDYKNPEVAKVLKEYCQKKYWRKREFVDAEISARLGMADD